MYYYNQVMRHREPVGRLFTRIVLVGFGLLIGASVGLYVAVRTLPLPNTTVNYIVK